MSTAAKTAAGAAWHLGSGIGVRAIGLIGTLVLTRFLAPAEYGEVLLAAACVITVTRSVTLGAATYVITHQAPPAEAFQAGVSQLALSVLGATLVCAAGDPLAFALGAPGMSRYLPGLALAAVVTQVAAVPKATLNRELHFRLPATAQMLGEVAYATVSVAAVPFLGAAAVVVGSLARSVLSTGLIVAKARRAMWWAPVWPKGDVFRRQVSFGLPLMGNTIAQTVSGYGDKLIVSRLYGPGIMGFYNLGFNVATSPTAYVADYAGDVMLAGLASVPERQRRRQAFLRALPVVTLLVFPLAFGLAVTAPTLVSALLDPRWAPIAPMITILSGIAVAGTVGSVANPYLLTTRRSRTILVLGCVRAGVLVLLLLTLGRLGPLWACASAALAAVSTNVGSLVAVCRQQGVSWRQLVGAVSPAAVASIAMVLAVLEVRAAIPGSWPGLVALSCEVASGVLCYSLVISLVAPRHVADVSRIIRELARRRQAPESGT